ncbi:MAG: hypothetical protein EON55_00170 [Alphaproteobacteria bacterium]|nr:MAG: hypothetical protein EON55_00170 [Alphaproteobacteria bacterium]
MFAAPVGAQSLTDSFRQLKQTVRQLGGRGVPDGDAANTNTAAEPSGQIDDGTTADLVPASALVDDASDSNLDRLPVVRRRVESFDILGFRLGMSPREVGRIAHRQGVRRQPTTIYAVTGSFELEATRLANAQLDEQVARHSRNYLRNTGGVTRDGTSVSFTFTLQPSGPKLSGIDYKAKRNGVPDQELVASLERKYGPHDARTSDYVWSNGASTVAGRNAGATLFVNFGGPTVDMKLSASNDYVVEARKSLEDRAAQIARRKGGGIKF